MWHHGVIRLRSCRFVDVSVSFLFVTLLIMGGFHPALYLYKGRGPLIEELLIHYRSVLYLQPTDR
jgi:hypothetical protein